MSMKLPDYEVTQQLGVTGLKRSNGYIYEEYHRNLSGKKAVKVYREMDDSSPIIGRWRLEQWLLISGAIGGPERADESPQATEVADFCKTCIDDMVVPMRTIVGDMLSSAAYGYSLMEKVYKVRAGHNAPLTRMQSAHNDRRIGIYDLSPRAQDTIDRWEFEDSGEVIGAWQSAPPSYQQNLLPLDKLLHVKFSEHKRSPEGRSLYRNVYRPWYMCNRIEDLEAIGVEKDMAGLFTISVPPEWLGADATTAQKASVQNLRDVVAQVRRGEHEGLIMPGETDRTGNPTGFKHGLIQSGGRRPIDQHEIIKRLESRQAIALMGDSALVGMNAVGALSLQDAKDHLASLMRVGLTSIMADALSEVYYDLTVLNGWPAELAPKHRFDEIDSRLSVEEMGGIASLVGSGSMTPGEKFEGYLRGRLNIPAEDEPSLGQMQDGLGEMDERDATGADDMGAVSALEAAEPIAGEVTADGVTTGPAPVVDPQEALNGAQVTALLDIVGRVNEGLMDTNQAVSVMTTAFPITDERARSILSGGGA